MKIIRIEVKIGSKQKQKKIEKEKSNRRRILPGDTSFGIVILDSTSY